MLDRAFLSRQRARLLRRADIYKRIAQGTQEGAERLDADRAHKRIILTDVIPMAIHRIDTGEYGTCIDCGEDIPQPRLEAIPAALRCVSCETLREQEQ